MPGLGSTSACAFTCIKQKAQRVGWAFAVVCHTRKIDMMGLIYDHFATTSSGINEDLFAVEYLGCVDHCGLFQRL